ncbi:MAG: hypothetical protein VX246_02955 [Myxococcota bacterium]|nr:hypothetical protein [Myxococcota bacterium]
MGHTSITLALILLGLACLAVDLSGRQRLGETTRTALLAIALFLAFIGHTRIVERSPDFDPPYTPQLTMPTVHTHEYLHYFLATKYFAEVAHDDLYEAIVIADFEGDPNGFIATNLFRNLRTNTVDRIRGDVITEGAVAKRTFSPERWETFVSDVGLLRGAAPSNKWWHESGILRDHGYNGTPLTTWLLGGLSNQPFVSSLYFIETMRFVDLFLIAGIIALAAWRFGAEAALIFGTLFFANPLNDFGFVGGSYLRYNFVLALIFAFFALESGRLKTAGAWLAVAGHFRIFPGLFAVGLLLHDAMRPSPEARRQAFHDHTPLYASFAATAVLLATISATAPAPSGQNVWSVFLNRITTHATGYGVNMLGTTALYSWSTDHSEEAVREATKRAAPLQWEASLEATVERRRPWPLLTSLAIVAASAWVARRLAWRHALLLGFPLMFAAFYLSHYYYLGLGMLALVFRRETPVLLWLVAGYGVLALLAVPNAFSDGLLRFIAVGACLLAMLLGAGWLATFAEPEVPDDAGGTP